MTAYHAPIRDMRFVYEEMGVLAQTSALPGFEEISADLVAHVLEEAGKLARDVIAPLNQSGDQEGAHLENGVVRTAKGWREAYRAYVDGGWNSVPFDPDHGGQGLPWSVAIAMQEMWNSANLSWALCPLLNQGAVEALTAHGSDEQKRLYLEKMISGEWAGTMNLTEPQAGSDLGLIKTRATPDGDRYRIRGQKIYITYGEHDLTENIVHLVLARLPDAPEGTRGISLFVAPKFLVNPDRSLGRRNDLRCVSLEHKLGIHASPTCVMAYGDDEGAVGFMVGEPNRGLEYMFTMMNNARLAVGLQGLSMIERAYQQARDYARERRQGRSPNGAAGQSAPIIEHPDVRRMLLTMRAHAEAMRPLVYDTMMMLDTARRHPDEVWRQWAQRRVDLLTPVIKGWFTETAVELTSLGVQVHGGMGFIEETGAAQYYRDARILPIYEGTNGIQAADLVGRKILRDEGEAAQEYLDELHSLINGLNPIDAEDIAPVRRRLAAAVDALEQATEWLLDEGARDRNAAAAAAAPYLRLFGIVAGGAMIARAAKLALERLSEEPETSESEFYKGKLMVARFYAENVLPICSGLLISITSGGRTIAEMPEDWF